MANDDLSKCLRDAVMELNAIKDLDAEEKAKILQRLEALAKKPRATPEDRIIAVEQAIRNSRRDLIHARVAYERNEEIIVQKLSDPRFREVKGETLEDVVEKAEALKRSISVAFGNVGDETDSVLTNKWRFEVRRLGAKFSNILDFVTDNKVGNVDSESAPLFYMEMVGLDSGSPRARELAQGDFKNAVASYLTRLRAAGVPVDVIKDFFPQSHGSPRIRADKKGWRELLKDKLDPEQHPDPESTIDALENSLVQRDITDLAGGGGIGMQRKIKLVDGEAELEYYYRFGNGTVAKDMPALIHKLAHATVLAEEWGPRPQVAFKAVKNNIETRLRNLDPDPAARTADKLGRRIDIAEDVIRFVNQPPTLPKYQKIDNFSSGARLGVGALKLGYVTISEVVEDSVLGTILGRSASGGYFRSFTDRVVRLAELLDNEGELRTFVESWGVWQNTNLMMTAARTITAMDGQGGSAVTRVGGEAFREASTTGLGITQRWMGAFWVENWQRSAAFMVMQDGATRMRNRSFGDLPPDYQKFLRNGGITKRDWDIIRESEVDPTLGILSPDDLERRSPATFRKYMTLAVSEAETQINYPDIESLLWAQGLRTDRYSPILRRAITQFWGWGISIQRRGIAREFKAGVVPGTIVAGGSMAAAAATLQLYTLLGGNPPYQWDSIDLWKRTLMRAAPVGPVVPTAVETVFGGPFTSIPGAVPGTIRRMGGSLKRGGVDALTGDIEGATAEGIKFGSELIPNWWMTDAATSTAVDAMIFELDPQELRNRNRRFREEQRMGY